MNTTIYRITESQIEAHLQALSDDNKLVCLELIMSLQAEFRLPYLNQFLQLAAQLESFDINDIAYQMAA